MLLTTASLTCGGMPTLLWFIAELIVTVSVMFRTDMISR